MPITSAVGHADAQAILDELGQPLLDELGRVIYDFDGFGGFGWAAGVGLAFTIPVIPPEPTTVTAFDGTKFYIGGTAEFSVSPDDAPWIEVGNISHLGAYGDISFSKIAMSTVGDEFTRQAKNLAFAPIMELTLNRDDIDAGQYAMRVASADEQGSYYNFKIEETLSGAILARTLFRGEVFSFEAVGGGGNSVKSIHTLIEVNPDTIINSVL